MKCLLPGLLLGVLAFGACSSDDEPKQATPAAGEPTQVPDAMGGPCPVEQDLCDFAYELEAAAREDRLPRYLPAPWPRFAEEAAKMWAVTGNLPRVTTIGCVDTGPNSSDCSGHFAVALSSLPEGLEEQDGRGLVVLFFERRGQNGGPLVKAAIPPIGERGVVVSGGTRGFCGQGIAPEGECLEFRFQQYRSGVPDSTVTPPPGQLPPLRSVYDATSKEITLGEPYAVKTGELWYFNYLCDACGPGPFPNLYRAYRSADGAIVIDDLKARTAELGQPVTFTADWQSATAYLATCTPGNCYYLEGADAESEAPATVYKTEDGGITWKRHGEIPSLTSFQGVVAGEILATTYKRGFEEPRYWFYPPGRELELPQNVTETVYPIVANNTILWRGESGTYYDGAGQALFGPLFAEQYKPQIVVADQAYQHTYVQWAESPGTPTSWEQSPYYEYVARIDRDGQMRELYGLPGDTMWIGGEFRRNGGKPPALFGRFRFGQSNDYVRDVSFGSVLDLETAKLHRFAELDANRPDGSFTWMQDLVQLTPAENGPQTGWLRVTGAETCLNVRETPGSGGRVFTCLADDVLVGDFGLRQTVDGSEWAQVRTPGGNAAWASTDFLR